MADTAAAIGSSFLVTRRAAAEGVTVEPPLARLLCPFLDAPAPVPEPAVAAAVSASFFLCRRTALTTADCNIS